MNSNKLLASTKPFETLTLTQNGYHFPDNIWMKYMKYIKCMSLRVKLTLASGTYGDDLISAII